MAVYVVLALGFWGLHFLDGFLFWMMAAAFLVYLVFRFRKVWICLVWIGLCFLTLCGQADIEKAGQEPYDGLYRIQDIRNSYVIAADGDVQVMVYGLEDASFNDLYELSDFSVVHTTKNSGVFCFQDYLNERGIYYQANTASCVKISMSVQAKLYRYFRDNGLYRFLFYNLRMEDAADWISSLGLPFMGFLHLLEKYLKRWINITNSRIACLFLVVIYGHFFLWNPSLVRLFIFRLCGLIQDWHKRWSLEVVLFLAVMPCAFSQFCFVLPALLSFGMHFQTGWKKKAISYYILAGMQILYFGKLDILSMLGFAMLRSLFGVVFGAGLVCLIPGLSVVQGILCEVLKLQVNLPVWWGSMNTVVLYAYFLILFLVCWKTENKRNLIFMLGWLGLYLVSFWMNPFFQVYMLDVGQGDCTVIIEPFAKSVVMIDAAGSYSGSLADSIMIPFLQSRHLMKIDALIITHQDQDHCGSRDDLMENYTVLNLIEDRDAEVPVDYDFISLLQERESEDENDLSIVNLFSYDDFIFLWTGDASSEIESELIKTYDVSADILKCGHHGSKTSSSEEFLEAVSPELALISCGYNNMYGHPAPATLQRLYDAGIDSLRTDQQGMISIKTWHHFLYFETASGLIGYIL